jgi:hypothetical protein
MLRSRAESIAMNVIGFRLFLLILLTAALSACASGYEIGQRLPLSLGGAPDTIPPPQGTPQYDAWLKKPNPKR